MIYTDNLDLGKYCFDRQSRSLLVTVTSFGYLDYTLNLMESLRLLGLSNYLVVFALDVDVYNSLLSNADKTGICLIFYPNNYNLGERHIYRRGRWHIISFYKIEIVHRLLRLGYDVLFTDSDIVFLRDPRTFLKDCLLRSDMLIQDDSPSLHSSCSPATTFLCTGFFYVKSNENTVEAFDPRHLRFSRLLAALWRRLLPHSKIPITDQRHFNKFIKYRLDVGILPRNLFPNGYYHYNARKPDSSCYLIHYNYLLRDEKRNRMIQDGHYFLKAEQFTPK